MAQFRSLGKGETEGREKFRWKRLGARPVSTIAHGTTPRMMMLGRSITQNTQSVCGVTSRCMGRRALSDIPHRLTPPEGFQPPTPKPMVIADGNYLGFVTASMATLSRLGLGVFVSGWTPTSPNSGPWPGTFGSFRDGSKILAHVKRPTKPIILYDSETSSTCRVVREACSMLDLIVEYRPCHEAGHGWSPKEITQDAVHPVMIDGDTRLSTSDAILEYLFEKCKSTCAVLFSCDRF